VTESSAPLTPLPGGPTGPAFPTTPAPAAPVGPTLDEVWIHYNPMPAAERVAHYSGLVRSRTAWLAIAVALCLVFWVFQGSALGPTATLALFGAGLGYSLIWLAMALIGLGRARRVLRSIGQGIALRLSHWGIDIHGATLPWSSVTAVVARRHRLSAYGPDLAVETADGRRRTLPWLFLDTLPGSVDAAVRAYTAGARRLDVSRLDH